MILAKFNNSPPLKIADILKTHLLADFEEIWAAAGTPNSVFRLTPSDLQFMTGADFHDVAQLEN